MSRRDDDLQTLLADLERTLADLREAVAEDARREARPRPRPRPPTPGEVLRFTESYTLPTAIALLEATARSLELLRAVLRLADPGERLRAEADDRTADALRGASATRLRDALGDLREALAATDLPEDAAARSVLDDARTLSAEIDERLAAARDATEEGERDDGRGRTDRGVDIVVTEAEDETEDADDGVDVDAELDSIRKEVRGDADEDGDDGE
ncbi:MAG: hypothetical protein ABEJ82_08215 [Haloplanus sp.]